MTDKPKRKQTRTKLANTKFKILETKDVKIKKKIAAN